MCCQWWHPWIIPGCLLGLPGWSGMNLYRESHHVGSNKEMWIPSKASKRLGSLHWRATLIDLENIAGLTHSRIDSDLTSFCHNHESADLKLIPHWPTKVRPNEVPEHSENLSSWSLNCMEGACPLQLEATAVCLSCMTLCLLYWVVTSLPLLKVWAGLQTALQPTSLSLTTALVVILQFLGEVHPPPALLSTKGGGLPGSTLTGAYEQDRGSIKG